MTVILSWPRCKWQICYNLTMNKRKNLKQKREQESIPSIEMLGRESLFISFGFAALLSFFVSIFLIGGIMVLIFLVQFPRIEWLPFLSGDFKMLAINASALFMGIVLFMSGTVLYGYLQPPFSIIMSPDRIEFSKWGRRYDIAFDELIGVEQRFVIRPFAFYWLKEYLLYTPEHVSKLPLRYIEGHYKVEDRLLERNKGLNNRRLEALKATAQLQKGTDSSDRLILTYSTIKFQQIIVDYEHNQIVFSEKKQLPADQIRKIIVDCKVSRENGGGRELIFHQQDGSSHTFKMKNYSFLDEEWFALLQNLHIAAYKLNIPLEVDIPPNRPLYILSPNKK